MGVAINEVVISKSTLNTGEKFKISVRALDITAEPVAYRLPLKLGIPRGHQVAQKN